MADTKISALTDGGIITSADSVPTARSGSNFRVVSPVGFNVVQVPNTILFTTDPLANSIVICEKADEGFNFAHPLQTAPSLFIQSATQATNQFVRIWHDGQGINISSTGVSGTQSINSDMGNARWFIATAANGVTVAASGANSTGINFTVASVDLGGIYATNSLTPDSSIFATGALSNSFHIAERADVAFDFQNGPGGTGACTNPTLIIHSATQSTTQWLSLAHNGTDGVIDVGTGGIDYTGVTGTYKYDRTITAGGTTGAQVINKTSGTVNFAAAATTLVVTNSLVNTSSIVFAVVRTADATATIKSVVPAAGSFTITLGAAATAETSVGFFVTN